MTITRRTKKQYAIAALVAGSFAVAGFFASAALADPCVGAGSTTHCDDPTRDAVAAAAAASQQAGEQVGAAGVQADRLWRAAGSTAESVGVQNPGDVSIPVMGGVHPPIGPIGPGPVGDGLRTIKRTVDSVDSSVSVDRTVAAVQGVAGGDVSIPVMGGVHPPIGPIGPVPVGDGDVHAIVDPLLGGGSPSAGSAHIG